MNNLDKFKHEGSEIAFVGQNWLVIKLSEPGQIGLDAGIYFGAFHEDPKCLDYFNQCIKSGPIFIVFPTNNKVNEEIDFSEEQYGFHFHSSQFLDKNNIPIDIVSFLNNQMSELKEYFKPEIVKNSIDGENKKICIHYPNNMSGKFIRLYGIESLFELIPENIVLMSIENSSKEDIAWDIPTSIGKFKNLSSLLFKGCVKSLPKEMGLLKKLKFLSVSRNPHLTELPEELAEIPELEFITVHGCDGHLKIPDVIVNRFSNKEPGMLILEHDLVRD